MNSSPGFVLRQDGTNELSTSKQTHIVYTIFLKTTIPLRGIFQTRHNLFHGIVDKAVSLRIKIIDQLVHYLYFIGLYYAISIKVGFLHKIQKR